MSQVRKNYANQKKQDIFLQVTLKKVSPSFQYVSIPVNSQIEPVILQKEKKQEVETKFNKIFAGLSNQLYGQSYFQFLEAAYISLFCMRAYTNFTLLFVRVTDFFQYLCTFNLSYILFHLAIISVEPSFQIKLPIVPVPDFDKIFILHLHAWTLFWTYHM